MHAETNTNASRQDFFFLIGGVGCYVGTPSTVYLSQSQVSCHEPLVCWSRGGCYMPRLCVNHSDRLIINLRFYVPLKNFSLIWRRHHYRWRAAKVRPMLGAQGLWAGRDLYCATPAVTWDLGFPGQIQRTAPFSRLLRYTSGFERSILARILGGGVNQFDLKCLVTIFSLFLITFYLYIIIFAHRQFFNPQCCEQREGLVLQSLLQLQLLIG
jgi:hypothetical protein